MAVQVIMPKVDMDQETGTVVQWLKQEGEQVKKGEPLVVIETSKVSIEVESPASGILKGIEAQPGQVVPIAQVIAYIIDAGEGLLEAGAAEAGISTGTSQAAAPTLDVRATPVARNMAVASGIDLAMVAGTGPRGHITKADVQAALASSLGAPPGDGKVYATPAARRIAREQGIALGSVRGSGPGSRIQAADVLASVATREAVAVPGPEATPQPNVEIVPLQGMRRTIAERMTASYQSVPHITFTARVDMGQFNEARARLNSHAEATGGPHVSAMALFVKTVAVTLTRHRWLNSALRGEEIYLYRNVNIGVAVALEAGLIVPVVRDADRKGLAQIAAEVQDLTARARAGQLRPADVGDGTFTISNLGPFGIEQFTAIINPPQAAILALGAIQLDAVPDAGGQIVARPTMRMTLSADHRVVDGAVAARFMADLKSAFEMPMLLLW